MGTDFKAWIAAICTSDGKTYALRLLATPAEIDAMADTGLLKDVRVIEDLQSVVDVTVALRERDALLATGGVVQ